MSVPSLSKINTIMADKIYGRFSSLPFLLNHRNYIRVGPTYYFLSEYMGDSFFFSSLLCFGMPLGFRKSNNNWQRPDDNNLFGKLYENIDDYLCMSLIMQRKHKWFGPWITTMKTLRRFFLLRAFFFGHGSIGCINTHMYYVVVHYYLQSFSENG